MASPPASARRLPLPRGTVTLLFSDIQGSTKLLQRLGKDYGQVLATHRRLLREAFARHGGCEVDTQGDAFFVAFGQAHDAVLAALESQRALRAQSWPRGEAVLVRMGLHTGEPLLVDDNYVGLDVHRAARICSAAHGGQVILSQATHDQLSPREREDVAVTDLGTHRLKDLEEPVRILQLTAPDLRGTFPPLRSLRPPTNVPRHLSSLVGRQSDRDELGSLLLDDTTRLVTVTGPGGIGKTRLCAALALDLLEHFISGAFFVDLTTATTADLVASQIAGELGIPVEAERDAVDGLCDHFANRRVLLVLDNFEQALEAAGVVARLLGSCPQLTVLVTSRVLLSVRGEVEYQLAPLGVPREAATPADVARSEAAQLFVERAARARKGFILTEDNAAAVAEICRLLDGLPLALELAAARVKLLDPEGLLRRLHNRLALLTGGAKDAPMRHRALRTTIDWSYDLLSPEDRGLFRDLAVFNGGSTLEAIEHVVGNDADILDALTSLVDHSLIRQRQTDGELRFSMLQTVRDYALELLDAFPDQDRVRDRHAHHYLELAERAGRRDGSGTAQPAQIGGDHDNLRAALDWWLSRAATQPQPYGELALRLAAALGRYWYTHGHAVEGSRWLERALAVDVARAQGVRANALRLLGVLTEQRRDLERATALFSEALAYFRRSGDVSGEAACLNGLGVVARNQGDLRTAQRLTTRSVEIRRELADSSGMSSSLTNLAIQSIDLNDLERAKQLLSEVMALDSARGDDWGVAVTSLNLGVAHLEMGELDQAETLIKRAIERLTDLGDLDGVAESIEALAGTSAAQRRFVRAARLGGAADALRRSLGIPLTEIDRRRWEGWLAGPRRELGDDAFSGAWTEGAAMMSEQAISYALETSPLLAQSGVVRPAASLGGDS